MTSGLIKRPTTDVDQLQSLRRLALSQQGLTSSQPFGSGLVGTGNAIDHLGYVQIDTLSVVERAHHHVLWSRVSGYDPSHLNQLVAKQQVFEYWFHAAAYLPVRDYRFALPQMHAIRSGDYRYHQNVDEQLMQEILARVDATGPLRLRDLDAAFKGKKKGPGSWWNMAPGKRAIERLFMQGDLMVCERQGMEKVYDLTERCLPASINLSMPSLNEYAEYLFDTTCRAHGVFTWQQLIHLKTGQPMREAMRRVIDERIEAGVVSVVEGPNGSVYYVGSQILEPAKGEASSRAIDPGRKAVKVLSPFDNVLIHRDRLSALFDFDYRLECYIPAAKRVHGYFCLPILFGEQFVGRIDCKAHRNDRRLEVLRLHLEDQALDRATFFAALNHELKDFAAFNQCPQLDDKVLERSF